MAKLRKDDGFKKVLAAYTEAVVASHVEGHSRPSLSPATQKNVEEKEQAIYDYLEKYNRGDEE